MPRAFLVLSLALVVSACGAIGPRGEDDAARAQQHERIAFTKSTARQTAKAMLVQDADLPGGWGEERKQGRPTEVDCEGVPRDVRPLAGAMSSMFVSSDDEAALASAAAVYPSERRARRAFARLVEGFRSRAAEECFARAFRNRTRGGEVGPFTRVPYRAGDRAAGFRAKFHIHTVCGCLRGAFSFVLIQERQATAWIVTARTSTRLAPYERAVASRVARRMRLAQAARDPNA